MMRRVVRTIRMINRAIGNSLRLTRDIFDDWLTRAAAMICVVIIAVVIFTVKQFLLVFLGFLLGILNYIL